MATRKKTICFAADTYTVDIADATLTNLAQFTVRIPETVIAFASVFVEFGYQDAITATGGTVTEHRVALRLGAAAYTTKTETDDITNTAENMAGVIGPFDFAAHFTTNWSGTSMTCDVQCYVDYSTGTTLVTRNATAMVYVTYTYDDDPAVNPTQIKTVRIPMESLAGALPTVANSNFGTNQIPQLTGAGGILPEDSVVIRDYFFRIDANEQNNNATTDWTLSVNIDGGTARSFGVQEAALGSDRFCRWIHKPASVPATSAAHQWQMWSSTARANMACVDLVVTYEFDATATTRTLVSICLPIEIASPLGVNVAADASRFARNLFVQDPGTITLRQSAFRIHFNTTAAVSGLAWRAGSQAFRTYTHAANVACGMYVLQQRIDSGSAQGAGITLARGENSLTVDGFSTDTTDEVTNISGYLTINYEADVAAEGIGANTHTVMQVLQEHDMLQRDNLRINNFAFAIPEAEFWIVSAGFILTQWQAPDANAISFDVQCLVGEGKGAGYYDIYTDACQSDGERRCSMTWMRGRDVFRRHASEQDPERLDIETARDYRLFCPAVGSVGMVSVVTYHGISYNVTRSISGSDGGTVNIRVCRSSNGEIIEETSRVGDGTYSFVWHDNVEPIYTLATDASGNAGRSEDFTAS